MLCHMQRAAGQASIAESRSWPSLFGRCRDVAVRPHLSRRLLRRLLCPEPNSGGDMGTGTVTT